MGDVADEIGLSKLLGHNRYFLYARTSIALEYASEALDELSQAINHHVYVLCPFGSVGSWLNGFVLRIHSKEALDEIAGRLSSALSRFDAWVIHDGIASARESHGHGLVTRYFAEAARQGKPFSMAQIFLTYADDERDPDTASPALATKFRGLLLPAFHFADGRILLFRSAEPAPSLCRRTERSLGRLHCISIADADGGEACSLKEYRPLWEMVNLEETDLRFFAEDQDEG